MFALIDGENVVRLLPMGAAFLHDDHQYPANWLEMADHDAREALGIFPVVLEKPAASRYASLRQNPPIWDAAQKIVRVTYTVGKIDLGRAMTTELLKLKNYVSTLLATSDQMVLDAHDHGTPMPSEWVSYRAAIQKEHTRIQAVIGRAGDEQTIVAVLKSASWPEPPTGSRR